MTMLCFSFVVVFNHTASTEIYTLSLHDALPILANRGLPEFPDFQDYGEILLHSDHASGFIRVDWFTRSEEHTSELQSRENLVCRLLLEKKKKKETKNLITARISESRVVVTSV